MLSCIKRRQDKTTRHIRHKTQDTRHETWDNTYRNNTQDTTHKRQHTRHEKLNIKTSRICVSCVVVLSCLVVVLGMRVSPAFCWEVQLVCMKLDSCSHAVLLSKRAQHSHASNNNKTRQDNNTREDRRSLLQDKSNLRILCCEVVLLRCAPVMRNSQCVRDWNLWTHSLFLRKEEHGSKTTWQHNTCRHRKRQQCDVESEVAGDTRE